MTRSILKVIEGLGYTVTTRRDGTDVHSTLARFARYRKQLDDEEVAHSEKAVHGMQQELFKDRLALCQSQREVKRYERVSFKNYVRRVFALKG